MGMGGPGMGMASAEGTVRVAHALIGREADPDKTYAETSRFVNAQYEHYMAGHKADMQVRTAGFKFKSAAHEAFLDSLRPVNGMGAQAVLGPLPDNMGTVLPIHGEPPLLGGASADPKNLYALFEYMQVHGEQWNPVRIAAKRGDKGQQMTQPHLFTGLEQKLYKMICSADIPFAFYAQYTAGPGQDYQLDGAFPALRLGIEADGETWHTAPEKIASDRKRDMSLTSSGWHILRFTEDEIDEQAPAVLQVISDTIRALTGQQSQGGQKSQSGQQSPEEAEKSEEITL